MMTAASEVRAGAGIDLFMRVESRESTNWLRIFVDANGHSLKKLKVFAPNGDVVQVEKAKNAAKKNGVDETFLFVRGSLALLKGASKNATLAEGWGLQAILPIPDAL